MLRLTREAPDEFALALQAVAEAEYAGADLLLENGLRSVQPACLFRETTAGRAGVSY